MAMDDTNGGPTLPASGSAATAPTRFEQLAKVVLALGIIVVVLAAALVLPETADDSPERALTALVAVVLAGALPVLALGGLFLRTPWRLPVASTALWFIVLSGVLETVTGGTQGQLRIPFLAIAAFYVLLDRAPRRVEGFGAIRALAVALGAAALIWYLVGLVVFAPA